MNLEIQGQGLPLEHREGIWPSFELRHDTGLAGRVSRIEDKVAHRHTSDALFDTRSKLCELSCAWVVTDLWHWL